MANADQESNGLMRIAVFVDPQWVWRWQKWLIDALLERGHQLDLCMGGNSGSVPSKLRLLLQLEKLLYRRGGKNASDLLKDNPFDHLNMISDPTGKGYDLMVDLAGNTALASYRCRRFRPLYEGRAGIRDLIGILLDGHAPRLSLDDSALAEPRRVGLCAVEQPEIILRGLDNVYSRVAGALLKSVDELANNLAGVPPDGLSGGRSPRTRRTVPLKAGRFLVGNLSAKIVKRLNRLLRRSKKAGVRWGTGWRFTSGDCLHQTNEFSIEKYIRLRDDGARFYADPFVIRYAGLAHVFVEEFPFDTQKGIISHFTIDDKGRVSTPKMVLSRPYHLSYPFVFEQDGQYWMIPETSGNRSVELYRAVQFPDKWVLEKTLIDDIEAGDVTLIHHAERLWMFAAISDWQSSSWDALGLFYADDLFSDWQAHQANPVLLDARAARPAGAMYHKDGVLWRPAQDCSTGYGAGLSLCRVDRLDPERYEQTVMQNFSPNAKDGLFGFHTLNENQGIEVIDFFGRL